MPTSYNFTENGLIYSFDDIFVPADSFRQGNLWGWGSGNFGRLGANNNNDSATPITTFSGGVNWKQVGSGGINVVGVKSDGTLWTWGSNDRGQLGTNNTLSRSTPGTTFVGGTDWRQVSSGPNTVSAIKTDGTLWIWGNAYKGTIQGRIPISTPVTTSVGGTNWKQVSTGYHHTAALKTDGTLWTWGYSYMGQLGKDPSFYIYRDVPTAVFSRPSNWNALANDNFPSFSSSGDNTHLIKNDGTLWVWGKNISGELGTNNITSTSTPVTTFTGGTNWKQVSSGGNHTAAIKTDGTLWTWGSNTEGQLGRAIPNDICSTPVTTFAGGTNWADTPTTNPEDLYTLSAGYRYTAAIKTDGTLWTWGNNSDGQLGIGDLISRSTPITTFTGGTNWKQVSSSFFSSSTSAIKTDGTLWTWGNGLNGQLGILGTEVDNGVTVIANSSGQISGTSAFTSTTTTAKRVTTTGSSGTVTSIAYSLLGPASLTSSTTPVSGNTDDGFWPLSLPFTISYNGTNYTDLYLGTNSYITFGAGSTQYASLNFSNPALPKIMISSADNSAQRVYYGTEGIAPNRTYRIIFEGTNATSGILGSPNMLWEAVFYENAPSQFDIHIGLNAQYASVLVDTSTPVTTFAGGTNWRQVSSGSNHTAAVKTDGTLWVWGINGYGSLGVNNGTVNLTIVTPVTTFAGGTNWKQINCGQYLTAAIKTDGTLWTWGNGNFSQLGTNDLISRSTPVTTFAGGTDWKQVSTGFLFTTAVKTDGTLWVWGRNNTGQLGTNDVITKSTPVTTFAGGTNWKQVSSGEEHMAAIKTDGTLWTWGSGNFGRLGTNDISFRLTPVTTFAGGTSWKQVSCAFRHTVALRDDGVNKQLFTFGYDAFFALGRGVVKIELTPSTTFAGGTNWRQVSSGSNHTAAVKTDGTLWTWGFGGYGELGNLTTVRRSTPVTTFSGGFNWKQVSLGNRHTTAIKTDGTLWVWGKGTVGQLGINFSPTAQNIPVTTFAGGTNWGQVSAGGDHTAAVKIDGTLWTWGYGGGGQLGNNELNNKVTPVTTFAGGTGWSLIAAGNSHTSVIKGDGTLWTWGNNASGQLGTNDITLRSTPVTTFAGGTNWQIISSGSSHAKATKTDGTLWTWGLTSSGQLGNASITPNRSTPVTTFAGGTNWINLTNINAEDLYTISAGRRVSSAIKLDGTLWTWGYTRAGSLGNAINSTSVYSFASTPITTFAGGTDWKQVSCGKSFYAAAIKTDGTLWTWGNNISRELGNNSSVASASTPVTTFVGGTNWKQVSSGDGHMTAVKTDGTLWTWGNGLVGQLGNALLTTRSTPVTTFAGGTNWKQVSAGSGHVAAIKTDGTLWTWGSGLDGDLGINVIVSKNTPVTTFAGGTNWKQVSCSQSNTAAVKTDGTLWTWGFGGYGILGNNNTINSLTPVTTFAGGTNWNQVSAGEDHMAAIKTDGTLWTWGSSRSGQLGNAISSYAFGIYPETNRLTPVTTFVGGSNWVQVNAGEDHTIAITSFLGSYEVFLFGSNLQSQLGTGFNVSVNDIPSQVFGNSSDWKQVDCGYDNTSAIKTDGTLWTWGRADKGILGIGGDLIFNRITPVTTFIGGTNWKQVSVGGYYTDTSIGAIKTDGTLWVWGNQRNGLLGNNNTISVAISTPITTFAGGTNWKQVNAGAQYMGAIKTDGTLWTWGYGGGGQLGNNSFANSATPVTTFAGGTKWRQVEFGFGYGGFGLTYEDPVL